METGNYIKAYGQVLTKVATRKSLRNAFHKVAMRKSEATQQRVLTSVMNNAFGSELYAIDPEFAKTAGFWGSVWGGLKSAGNAVGGFLGKYGMDILLTGMMFVPGLNIVGGLGRLAMGAYRGARAIRAVGQAGRAVNVAQKGMQAAKMVPATKALHAYKGLRAAGSTPAKALAKMRAAAPGARVVPQHLSSAQKAMRTAQTAQTTARGQQTAAAALRQQGKQQFRRGFNLRQAPNLAMGGYGAYSALSKATAPAPYTAGWGGINKNQFSLTKNLA